MNPITQCCDWTTCVTLLLAMLSIVGFGIVVGVNKPDNIFNEFSVDSVVALDAAIQPFLPARVNFSYVNVSVEDAAMAGTFGEERVSLEKNSRENPATTASASVFLLRLLSFCLGLIFFYFGIHFYFFLVENHPVPKL